ncbi:hypothetical protein BGAL_0307g00160 [Botrytis galanthina]|uniref:Uncharacterized protein n=1 Tax=Botrytis galanthina TaxID=278940 RepID=A0A4S8QUE2_9HELO|nr:hypothetical protein BGAL_0307g00160 [Botrytis galanthina]
MSADDATQQQRTRRDDTLASRQVAQAQRVVFEYVSTIEDVHLVLVSSHGYPLSAKRTDVGARTSKYIGHMSDQPLQTPTQIRVVSSSTSPISTPREQLDESTAESLRHHGAGHTL